jgi:membrane protein YdbS with pleckstrin-like domain
VSAPEHHWLVRLLRVPAEPEPPLGSPLSLRVVRASDDFVRYRRATWIAGHAVVALIFGVVPLLLLVGGALAALADGDTSGWLVALLLGCAALLALGWLALFAIGLKLIALDRDWRFYMLTDRSLRIREGLLHVREITLTYANVQNVSVSQGPLERLFKIASLKVQTAGGGGGASQHQPGAVGGHHAELRGLADAEALRDEIIARVRAARAGAGGVGGLAPRRDTVAPASNAALSPATLAALRKVAAAAAALRAALS